VRFAYTEEFATEILASALHRRGWDVVAHDHPEDLAASGDADIVLTSPLEYARALGVIDYALVPGFAVVTEGFAGLMKLAFNPGLADIGSLAIKRPGSYESLVAGIVLSEKHDIAPDLVVVSPESNPEEMLGAADVALLTGDDAVFDSGERRSLLDLTDEWEDIAETALPYKVAWGRVGEVPQEVLADLIAAREEAVLMLPDHAAHSRRPDAAHDFYQHYLRGEIRYGLEDADLAALDACYRYLFYYGTIQDMPALKYLPDGAPAGAPPEPPAASNGDGAA